MSNKNNDTSSRNPLGSVAQALVNMTQEALRGSEKREVDQHSDAENFGVGASGFSPFCEKMMGDQV